jgi:hypothetical protein
MVKWNYPDFMSNDQRLYKSPAENNLGITHNRPLLIIITTGLLTVTTKRTITQHKVLGKIYYVSFSSDVSIRVVRLPNL